MSIDVRGLTLSREGYKVSVVPSCGHDWDSPSTQNEVCKHQTVPLATLTKYFLLRIIYRVASLNAKNW